MKGGATLCQSDMHVHVKTQATLHGINKPQGHRSTLHATYVVRYSVALLNQSLSGKHISRLVQWLSLEQTRPSLGLVRHHSSDGPSHSSQGYQVHTCVHTLTLSAGSRQRFQLFAGGRQSDTVLETPIPHIGHMQGEESLNLCRTIAPKTPRLTLLEITHTCAEREKEE